MPNQHCFTLRYPSIAKVLIYTDCYIYSIAYHHSKSKISNTMHLGYRMFQNNHYSRGGRCAWIKAYCHGFGDLILYKNTQPIDNV